MIDANRVVVGLGGSVNPQVTFFSSFLLEFPGLGVPTIVGEILRYIFMVFPNYALSKGFAVSRPSLSCPVVPYPVLSRPVVSCPICRVASRRMDVVPPG
jgi:hypothetical protein